MTDPANPDAPLRGGVDLAALAAARKAEESLSPGTVNVTEQNLQDLAEKSMQAPVLILFSSSASPQALEFTSTFEDAVAKASGSFVVGQCDVDAQPALAQAFQIQAVPAVVALIGGRPAPLFQGTASEEQIADVLSQVLEIAGQAGVPGASEAANTADATPAEATPAEPEPEPLPPLHQEAFDAIERGDFNGALAAYDKALIENPRDGDARAGRAQVGLMQRAASADLQQVRQAAADAPQDVDAQLAVADMDIAGGQVEDAFVRLIDLVRVSADDDRERIRTRLVELFDVVGGADPRVVKARQALANALY